jgi:hypothetical protein
VINISGDCLLLAALKEVLGGGVYILAAVVTRRRATESTDFCHWHIKNPVPWNEIASVVAEVGWSGGRYRKVVKWRFN